MSGSYRAALVVLRWTLLACQLVGIGCAVWAAMELLDPESRGSHVFGVFRWPAFALASAAAAVALASVWADVVRPPGSPKYPRALRDLFVVTVAVVASQVLLSTNFKPFLCGFTFGVGGGLFATVRLLDRAAGHVRDLRVVRVFEFVTFQVSLILVSLELVLRLIAIIVPMPIFARDESSVESALAMYQYPPGTVRDGFPMNRSGHYDEEFVPGERNVVSIGDSFSIGIVPHQFHFTTVCERELEGVEVYNLGRAGIGPGGYLWFLEHEGLAWKPDLIVINLFAGNDMEESKRWNNSRSLIRSLCDRHNVLTFQVPKRLWRMLREEQVQPTSGSGRRRPADTREIRDPRKLRAMMPWIDDPILERPTLSEDAFARIEAERANQIQGSQKHGTYQKLFDVLETIHEVAAGVPLVVMLIPDQFQVDEDVWRSVTTRVATTLDRDQPQKRITDFLKSRGIPCLDLLPVLRRVEPLADGHRHLYHLRDTHFNVRGNRVAGEALAGFLRDLLR
jgi:SGNH hydrolase-like domain, acetyltransferase AlgX